MANNHLNYVSAIKEEIALEGLDGITISALWIRLNDRPDFPIKATDDDVKIFLWRTVSRLSNVDFYLLPEPRKPLVLYNRFKYIDSNGNYYEPDDLPEIIYHHSPVDEDGILGSCATYKSRKNITDKVRGKQLNEVLELWGEALVVVADQPTRKFALCTPDLNPNTEMLVLQYCFLERIGRSRYNGEVTQGKLGLQTISDDSKVLFYYRKFLSKYKLITKQVFHLKVGKMNCTGSLLHLPKYCVVVKSKQLTDTDKLIEYLKSQPQKFIPYKDLYKVLDRSIGLKKLLQKQAKVLKAETVPYRTMYPDAKPSEWKIKSSGLEKSVRILRLIESNIPVTGEDEEEDDDDEGFGFLDERDRLLDRTVLRQCYSAIEKSGSRGMTQASISSQLALSSLQSRSICKQLLKKNVCGTILIDCGRQRIGHFYSKKYDSHKSGLTAEVTEEKNKLLQMINHSEQNSNSVDDFIHKDSSNDNSTLKNVDRVVTTPTPDNSSFNMSSVEDSDKIETEIIISSAQNSGLRSFPSLTEEVKSLEPNSSNLTYRVLKRANLIMQAVKNQKVIQDPQKLQRLISEEEDCEGVGYTIDRKTVLRLVEKLEADGHIKTIKINLKGHGKERNMMFICHPSVTEDHSEIQSAIEQAKMKLSIITQNVKTKPHNQNNLVDPLLGNSATKEIKYKTSQRAGKQYGYKPKFVRMQLFHTYMYYLIYGYDGSADIDQNCKYDIIKEFNLDPSLAEEMSHVYRISKDWKMFLPPLPSHKDYDDGWCLMSDLLLRLPLFIFVAIVNVSYEIPEMLEYIEHPVRRYYLVKHLPADIVNHLTIMRKYIFIISEIVQRLCYIGLVQMGPQRLKEKDQVFLYLNRNACLLDTTPSDLGYNHISKNTEYEQLSYTFKTLDDVQQYWYDLWNFAMHTNLGCRNILTGQAIVVESINTKKILLISTRPKGITEAKLADVGYIPGDKMGAAGIDSDLFVHLKRNWYWPTDSGDDGNCTDAGQKNILYPPSMKRPLCKTERHKKTHGKAFQSDKMKNADDSSAVDGDGKNVESSHIKTQVPPKKKLKKSQSDIIKINTLKEPWKKRSKSKKITRILKPKLSKYGRKPYYDQVDKEALKRMVKLRVGWTTQEDNLLLICKVASLYMCPNRKRHLVRNFCAVREILHSTFPETSRNKTSRACQRRMLYMMKNPSTVHSVYVCLEEIRQDHEITARFDKAVEKLDAMLKAQREGLTGFQKEYDKIFNNLVFTLMQKLKTVERKDKSDFVTVTIPDTKQEFYNMFNVIVPRSFQIHTSTFNEIQNNFDIICGVVNTVIHSSLCCSNDKTSYSYQLFHIYQQYSDKLLRSVMAKCRSMSIVSYRKKYKRWKTASHGCLPLSSSPYQLSNTYANILQTRYQYPIFSESYWCLKSIVAKLEKLEQDEILAKIANTDDGEVAGSSVKNCSTGTIELEVHNGGECANVVELYSAGFVKMYITFPEHLIILDPRLSSNEESYSQIMERFKELLSMITDKTQKDSQKTNSSKKEEDDDFDEEDDDCNEESNSKNETRKESDNEEFNLSNKVGVAKAASRLAVYMMRDEPLESLDKSLQHAHDYFVLNPCKISVKLENKEEALEMVVNSVKKEEVLSEVKRLAIFPETYVENTEIIEKIGQKLMCINEYVLSQFLDFLEGKKEMGATYLDIEENFGKSQDIQLVLQALVDNQFILKSGVVNVRFIHNKFTKSWLVRSYHIPRLIRESLSTTSAQAVGFSDDIPEKKLKIDDPNDKGDEDVTAVEFDESNNYNAHCIAEPEEMILETSHKEFECHKTEIEVQECNNIHSLENPESMEKQLSEDEINKLDEKESSEKDCDNESNKVLVKRKKRKWVNLSKASMDKFNELDDLQMKNVHVIIRPWIKIDGTLNRRVLDRLLGSVLGHCLSVPGITMEKLQSRFTPALQPIHTLELVQILEKIGCIHVWAIQTDRKPTLFSQRSESNLVPATGFERLSATLVEPDLLAISKLGQFIGEKAYKVDYLDSISASKHSSYS